MTKSRSLRLAAFFFGSLLIAWLVGFFAFITLVERYNEPVINPALEIADAIVVLTGGSDRLSTGVELLVAGKGRKLLVSGVHPGLTLDSVLAKHPVEPVLRDCCIFLGHAADNTLGNATETHAWISAENFHSLRLVTAHYHMPRSLLIFHRIMPETTIFPHPVVPESVKLESWWSHTGTASLLMTEYNKYLYALLNLPVEALP
ncbi:MAG: YdcF family protein [Alphaproteobacteria bacterium]|nr:YdcF family protein [Alphaproteobacteria bacterium]